MHPVLFLVCIVSAGVVAWSNADAVYERRTRIPLALLFGELAMTMAFIAVATGTAPDWMAFGHTKAGWPIAILWGIAALLAVVSRFTGRRATRS